MVKDCFFPLRNFDHINVNLKKPLSFNIALYRKQVDMEIQIFVRHHSDIFTQEWPLGFSLERKPTSLLLMSIPCIILKILHQFFSGKLVYCVTSKKNNLL